MHVRVFHAHMSVYMCVSSCVCIHTCALKRVRCTPDRKVCAGRSSEAGGHGGMWPRNTKTCVPGVGVRGQPEGAVRRPGCENPGNRTKSLNVFFFLIYF